MRLVFYGGSETFRTLASSLGERAVLTTERQELLHILGDGGEMALLFIDLDEGQGTLEIVEEIKSQGESLKAHVALTSKHPNLLKGHQKKKGTADSYLPGPLGLEIVNNALNDLEITQHIIKNDITKVGDSLTLPEATDLRPGNGEPREQGKKTEKIKLLAQRIQAQFDDVFAVASELPLPQESEITEEIRVPTGFGSEGETEEEVAIEMDTQEEEEGELSFHSLEEEDSPPEISATEAPEMENLDIPTEGEGELDIPMEGEEGLDISLKGEEELDIPLEEEEEFDFTTGEEEEADTLEETENINQNIDGASQNDSLSLGDEFAEDKPADKADTFGEEDVSGHIGGDGPLETLEVGQEGTSEEALEKIRVLEEEKSRLKERAEGLKRELDGIEEKVLVDVNRMKRRERELEDQLELALADAQSQVQGREKKIMELQRRIDQLEFNMENMAIREKRFEGDRNRLEENLGRTVRALRHSVRMLEEGLGRNPSEERQDD